MSAIALQAAIEAKFITGNEKLALMAIADNTCQLDAPFEVSFKSILNWTGLASTDEVPALLSHLCDRRFVRAVWDDEKCEAPCVRGYLNIGMDMPDLQPRTMPAAPPVWHPSMKLRNEVLSRDGRKCHYCGSTKRLTLDHVVPRSQGGSHDADNLLTACRSCNAEKGVKSYEEYTGRALA
jgi:5-methylcytosine-specific restriction endonuclease McrA